MKKLILMLSLFGFAASAQSPAASESAENGPSHIEESKPARDPAKKHAKKKSKKKTKKKHDKHGA